MRSLMTHLRLCLAAVLLLANAAGAQEIRPVALTSNDLVYDPGTHRIYASVPSSVGAHGNSILAFDPVTGLAAPSVFIGSEPDRLALSDDGQYLYVGLDGAAAVRRFDLKSQTAGPQFSLGSGQLPGPTHAGQIQVMPGHPQTVAVVVNNAGGSPTAEGVAIYDNGVQRPRMTSWTDFIGVITFGRSADRLYGYVSESSSAEFVRMAVDASGLTVLDKATPGGLGGEMKFADGLIYGSTGLVIDPETRQPAGTFKGHGFNISVAPDLAAGRVYILSEAAPGSGYSLLTFDARTFRLLGTLALPGVMGQASRLIRWGQERGVGQGGLAFRTDQGQVFLISLAPPAPASADLALTAAVSPNPVVQRDTLTVTLTVTNYGPDPATGVILSQSRPVPPFALHATQGSCQQANNQIICDFGTLPSGAQASVTELLQLGGDNAFSSWSSTASVTANEPDPNPGNNKVELHVDVIPFPNASAPGILIRQLALPANDLAYDPATHQLYASTPSSAGSGGNSIVSVDPTTGAAGAPVFIGSEPDKLALSDDGQYLYVALDGAAAVRRFDTAGQMAGLQFSLGADSFLGPYYVGDMAVMPGSPDTVAVARVNRNVSAAYAGVAVFDHGVPRGKMTGRQDGVDVIAFASSPNRLYGYNNETTEFGFRRMTVDAAGVKVDDVSDDLIEGFFVDMRYDQGLIFSTSGREIDPEARTLLGTFSGIGNNALVAPDVKAGRVYFLTSDSASTKLLIFDPKTFLQTGEMTIPGVMGKAHSLIRWGRERSDGGGLAFATDQGQVFLIALNPPAPPAPSPALLSLTLAPSSITGGGTVTATVTLTSPAPAGGFTVDLFSSRPAAASLATPLIVPAGALTASTPVTVSAVSAPADVVITASAAGITRTATLHLNPPPPPPPPSPTPAQLALYPNPVPGGLLALGQLTLPQPAGPGGATISLTSSSAAALVPAAVFVPAGASTVTFPIITFPVMAPTLVTITAGAPGGPATAVLRLLPVSAPSPAANPPVAAAVPAGPSDLAVTAVTSTRVTLTWKNNSTDETALAVWRKGGGADWARVGALPPNTTAFTDTGLTPGATYTYRVRAIRGDVASDWSNEVSVTVPGGV